MIVPTGWLSSLCCTDCGSTAAMITIEPGRDGVIEADILLQRGADVRGWCRDCAIRRGWLGEPKDVAA
jgi:hypothetical protein